jgi:hypothetical protein
VSAGGVQGAINNNTVHRGISRGLPPYPPPEKTFLYRFLRIFQTRTTGGIIQQRSDILPATLASWQIQLNISELDAGFPSISIISILLIQTFLAACWFIQRRRLFFLPLFSLTFIHSCAHTVYVSVSKGINLFFVFLQQEKFELLYYDGLAKLDSLVRKTFFSELTRLFRIFPVVTAHFQSQQHISCLNNIFPVLTTYFLSQQHISCQNNFFHVEPGCFLS